MPNVVELIITKRDGGALAPDELRWLVAAYTRGEVPDYQMSAFLMAAFLRGLSEAEMDALTEAMLHSGRVLDLSDVPGRTVDKHSTGGVGDKVSLILAPLVAACGVPVPMISGRGLGHTGGTLDKLEAIPGLRTDLSVAAFRRQLRELGVVMIGQTDEIAPADRKLYALRDVTGTIESIPLIAASILSKKLAEGAEALVFDVKCGRGAFMRRESDARRLAETLVGIATRAGRPAVAWLTDMNVPLGRAVGNWPEVVESLQALRGDFTGIEDLIEVTLTLAGEMLWLGGVAQTPEDGRRQARQALQNGQAFTRFCAMVQAQGGDVRVLERPDTRPDTEPAGEVRAPAEAQGYVADLDARAVGRLAVQLGAGRRVKEDPVDPTAGLVLHRKPGDPVAPGDVLATLYTRQRDRLADFQRALLAAYRFAETPPPPRSLLLARYAENQWTGVQPSAPS
ncbi:thymidine phosphorylase [Rhodothermus profundi]|uniref:thymidine phosphorylase n=1 Tax=Rhodothermus profundi TaxID=633813 RepID=A0A1M6XR34_9BACT|nr:thymidine phosphorylase [Rhodothermus profundi]SHL08457.1 thymidine phosphorylase [Rhodothermus profundi]